MEIEQLIRGQEEQFPPRSFRSGEVPPFRLPVTKEEVKASVDSMFRDYIRTPSDMRYTAILSQVQEARALPGILAQSAFLRLNSNDVQSTLLQYEKELKAIDPDKAVEAKELLLEISSRANNLNPEEAELLNEAFTGQYRESEVLKKAVVESHKEALQSYKKILESGVNPESEIFRQMIQKLQLIVHPMEGEKAVAYDEELKKKASSLLARAMQKSFKLDVDNKLAAELPTSVPVSGRGRNPTYEQTAKPPVRKTAKPRGFLSKIQDGLKAFFGSN